MKFWIVLGVIAALCLGLVYDGAKMALGWMHLRSVPAEYAIGPANADLTVYAFIDYACPECRKMDPLLMEAARQDGGVKIVPMPVYGFGPEEGVIAARMAYAAAKQGRFVQAHEVLISDYRALEEGFLPDLAAQIGADSEQLKRDFEDPEALEGPDRNIRTMATLKSQVTPTLIVGERVMFRPFEGTPSVEDLLALFAQGRKY